jgi:tetratricopeptide (TPR) repeat protein
MLAPSSLRRRRAARLIWPPIGAGCLLLLCLSAELCAVSPQSAEAASSAASQSPEQLTTTAESYEKFLRGPATGSPESRLEIQQHLGAVYFLLHRYRDSLDVLTPILRELPSQSAKKDAVSLQAQSWLVSGLDYLELNQLTDATRALRHSLAMQPDSANARLALGDTLARSGHTEEAAKKYEEQTTRTPSLADAWYKLGLAHSQLSAEISRATVKPAEQGLAQQLAAEELLAKGDNLNAARELFRVARGSPNQPDVQAELGSALLNLGYVKAAEDHFHQELATNPQSPLAELGLAQTSALTGNWAQAAEKLEHLSESQPRESVRLLEFPPVGLVVQAWAANQMNAPASFVESPAGQIWKSWLNDSNVVAKISGDGKDESGPPCTGQQRDIPPGVWLSEGCYVSLERKLKAKTNLTVAAKTKLAETEFRLGQYNSALHTAKLLGAADPHSGWAIYWLSKTHDAMAEQCFFKVGELNPDSARVHQMLAEHYLKLSDYPRARTEFQNAIRLTPGSPDLHLGLGTVLSRAGQLEQAEKELETTLDLAPKSAFAHYELGHVYVGQNQWTKAIEQLRQVPDDSSVLLSARLDLAKAESEMGQTSEAVRDLLSVANLDQDGELYFRLAGLYRTLGDDAHAREAMGTFKQRRAASLQADTAEVGALEREQEVGHAGSPQSP